LFVNPINLIQPNQQLTKFYLIQIISLTYNHKINRNTLTEKYHRWYSQNLGFDVEMLVFGDRGYPVILFPTSQGRYYQNKDEGLIESAKWFIDEGLVKIYCPDSFDWLTWYNKGVHPAE